MYRCIPPEISLFARSRQRGSHRAQLLDPVGDVGDCHGEGVGTAAVGTWTKHRVRIRGGHETFGFKVLCSY